MFEIKKKLNFIQKRLLTILEIVAISAKIQSGQSKSPQKRNFFSFNINN
jgi:hypothetical protein